VAGYVLLYYQMVPLLLVVAASTYLVSVCVTATRPVAVTGRVLAATGSMVVLLTAYTTTRIASTPADGQAYHDAAVALRDDPSRQGQPIGLRHGNPDSWPDVAGLGVELDQLGVPWCVVPTTAEWVNLYTAANMCNRGRSRMDDRTDDTGHSGGA
jgi:hypothetical protein